MSPPIDVPSTRSIVDAVALKLHNDRAISTATKEKLESCASHLYGIGNCSWRDTDNPGFKGLRAGLREVGEALGKVEAEASKHVKPSLVGQLTAIKGMIEDRIRTNEACLLPDAFYLAQEIKDDARLYLDGRPQAHQAPEYEAPPVYDPVQAAADGIENTRL